MVLDFHTHIFPEKLARRAMISMAENTLIGFYTGATGEELKDSMREAGITHSVVCNIATKPGQTAQVMGFARQTAADNPPGVPWRLIPLASVHPREPDALGWLGRVREEGFSGIKLHPDYQGFYINEPWLEPFYREANRLGLFILFHAGLDGAYIDDIHATPEMIADMLPIFERGRVILAHLGGYLMQDKVLELLCGENIYLDLSYNMPELPLETVREIIRRHGTERIIFGSDSPWQNQKQYLAYFRETLAPGFLDRRRQEDILWNNGARLLGLPCRT